jgi:hypothetical protein
MGGVSATFASFDSKALRQSAAKLQARMEAQGAPDDEDTDMEKPAGADLVEDGPVNEAVGPVDEAVSPVAEDRTTP